ncbi:hypothetical protein WR25_23260 [Diploscapter pachys]|uniref:G-protein coupled receptors family 1 profile domain-containing protein n=1 Tax=Diploscapter pachys TaxID=2018661 RepID=A0A2A2J697_9BILA|nr:hypothetical protein WR25_23260 [Diploscapter pachys]
MTTTISVEYVPIADTLSDASRYVTPTQSLTNCIIFSAHFIATFILNTLLLVTILMSKQLRDTFIYCLFAVSSAINLFDIIFNQLLSLINIANGSWMLNKGWCNFNVVVQQFTQLYTLFFIMLMSAERAAGMILRDNEYEREAKQNGRYLDGFKVTVLATLLCLIAAAVSLATLSPAIPVVEFSNRYLCGIGEKSPIGYSIARIILYLGCLSVVLVCSCAIFRKRQLASLPQQSHEYSDFIRRNRSIYEHQSRAKLIYTSQELISSDGSLDVPQDCDTLITWLRFIYTLLCPISILCWCNDIWMKLKEVICCRSYEPPILVNGMYQGYSQPPSVMTLVATPEGLQLRMPESSMPMKPIYNPLPPRIPPPVASPLPSLQQPIHVPQQQQQQQIQRSNHSLQQVYPHRPIANRSSTDSGSSTSSLNDTIRSTDTLPVQSSSSSSSGQRGSALKSNKPIKPAIDLLTEEPIKNPPPPTKLRLPQATVKSRQPPATTREGL